MEKWARELPKTTALIIGIVGIVIVIMVCLTIYSLLNGLITILLVGALLGGGVGFSIPLIYKGITGFTPREKRELSEKTNRN